MFREDRLRVVDLTGLLAGQLAARALSDAGASVVRIDPPSGNPLDQFADDFLRAHLGRLASFGKHSVCLDPENQELSDQISELLGQADVLILSHDTVPALRSLAIELTNPRAVVCEISIADGGMQLSDDPVAQDVFVQALAGTAQVNGDPASAPLPSAVGLLHSLTACHAAIAVLAACVPSPERERGVHVTISMRDVAISMALEHHALARDSGGRLPAARQGNHSNGDTLGIYRGSTSYYVIEVWGDEPDGMWARLAHAMDRPDLATDPAFSTDRQRVLRMPEIVRAVESWLADRPDGEIEGRLHSAKITFGRVLRSGETILLPQLRSRGLLAEDHRRDAGVWLPLSGITRSTGLRSDVALRKGECGVRLPLGKHFTPPANTQVASASGPLAGLKVVEIGAAIAGPMATRILADLGATVLKVEAPTGDMMRAYLPPTYEGVAIFSQFSAGKRSLALNLREPADLAIAKSFISQADIVIQNVTPGSLERLGLGYEHCRELNPKIIYCSVSGFGQTGRWRTMRAVDPTIQGWAGFASLMGEPDGMPYLDRVGYLDSGTAAQAALACIAEWTRGEVSGLDRNLDVSMLESALALDCFAAGAAWGGGKERLFRTGRLHPLGATVSVLVEDVWLFVEISGSGVNSPWVRLATALCLDSFIDDPEFVDDRARLGNSSALVALLDAALARNPVTAGELAAKGVAAVPALTPWEAVRDEAAYGRRMFESVLQNDGTACETMLMPWQFEDMAIRVGVCPELDEARNDLDRIFAP